MRKAARKALPRLLLRLLEHCLGGLPETVIERVYQLSLAEAEAMVDQVLGAESLAAFTVSLPEKLAGNRSGR